MKFIKINHISRSIVYLKQLSEAGKEFGIATGFLYQNSQDVFLITNKHVVTGRNPENNALLSKTGALPHKLIASIASATKSTECEERSVCKWIEHEIELYNKNRESFWHEHENQKVDVVAIKLNMSSDTGSTFLPLNTNKLYNFPIEITDDVFVIGYPVGITGGKKLPIWKRGSVASEPDINIDGVPKFIIDTSTREGMSGSPVIARSNIMLADNNGMIPDDEFFGAHYQFIGVYSGRLNSKDKENDFITQLGVVWKKEALEQILNRPFDS